MLTTLTDRRGEVRAIEVREHAPHVVRTGWSEGREYHSLVVKFGLHFIRGNHAPYFTLTSDGVVREGGRKVGEYGGANHEEIVREFPELADVAALHLSDIEGVPMHAEANGWYQLAGACGGFNERYHAGNAETYGRPRDPLKSFAEHCRISLEEAQAICEDVLRADIEGREKVAWKERVSGKFARLRWAEICESFKPRWKAEANAAIEKYGLTVHGDRWPKEAA